MKKMILLQTAGVLRKEKERERGQSHFSEIHMMRISPVLALMVFVAALFTLDISQAAAQTCRWDGTAPFCDGECGANETEMTRLDAIPDFWVPPFVNQNPPFGANCVTGTKALCCSTPGRTCRWDGTAPFCEGECLPGEMQAQPPAGSSSGSACWTGSKVYCCRSTGSVGSGLQASHEFTRYAAF